ncbi:hypothetical protein EJ06DRAFT_527880 [Trichodelitschia bisporula]|uniref:PLC-like phosphodiesterase n=1 Tax=Trichodelitschia bisporula TaxID=703511 RepID=A0A6G1I3M2_9PEZI|nr:hypothetical protein EJ06DRAFT_527880 [Trichodelitschia bisporula]
MPTKGVQIYTFISLPGASVEYTVPGSSLSRSQLGEWTNDHLEVDKSHIRNPFEFAGRFLFRVLFRNNTVTTQYVDINTLIGNIERGTMARMADQRAVITPDLVVSFGFYDAGPGIAGLPKADQCWVTVTPNRAGWMSRLAPLGSDAERKPFTRWVLPAAHDVGMNSLQTPTALIQSAGKAVLPVFKGASGVISGLGGKMSDDVLLGMLPNIIQGLAITQKDSLGDILATGARYFEFRPAHLHSAVRGQAGIPRDALYFTHGPIPGMPYAQFLADIATFLLANTGEIVVVQLRWDGVPAECARPSDGELASELNTALGRANGQLVVGDLGDLQRSTTAQLREQKKRLIICRDVDSLSTYTDGANATLNGDSIVAEFEKLGPASQNGKAFTNLQCQATATNIKDVVAYSVVSAGVSNSCLLATKPICDWKTLPWIRRNALNRLKAEQLVVVMNDFFDGATADVAAGLSDIRLKQ